MEKTLARAIYKKMELNRPYTTTQLFDLIGDDYYKYIPAELQGKDVRKIVSAEMWKVVSAGYAQTYTKKETLPNIRGIKFGDKFTSYTTYCFRYFIRIR